MSILVGVVFYGKDEDYINKYLQDLLVIPDIFVYAVFNSVVDSSSIISSARLFCYCNDTNTGSAGGFYKFLQFAMNSVDFEHIITLDDDLFFCADDLSHFLDEYNALSSLHGPIILLARRIFLNKISKITSGFINSRISDFRGGFYRFNILHVFFYLEYLFLAAFKWRRYKSDNFKMYHNCYWGGLMVAKKYLSFSVLHENRLFLYKDDVQFGSNFQAAGGKVFISNIFEIYDKNGFWINSGGIWSKIFPEFFGDPFRLYYSYGNTVYLQISSKSFIFQFLSFLSFVIYCPIIFFTLFINFKNFRVVISAIRDAFYFYFNPTLTFSKIHF